MLIMMISILSGALASLSISGAELTERTSRKAAGCMVSSHYDVAAMRVVGCEAPSSATRKKKLLSSGLESFEPGRK